MSHCAFLKLLVLLVVIFHVLKCRNEFLALEKLLHDMA
jgi:hypothetical protein